MIRKMRIGQLHGAGFRGVGFGQILTEVRVLDLPFLFDSDEEIQHVYAKMDAYFKGLDVQPIPLSTTDVLFSLQTGMVNTVYASTQEALALQWFSKVKHVRRLRMGYAPGEVLISKKKFDKLPPPYQDAVKKMVESATGTG